MEDLVILTGALLLIVLLLFKVLKKKKEPFAGYKEIRRWEKEEAKREKDAWKDPDQKNWL